jgi:hypothetical protein
VQRDKGVHGDRFDTELCSKLVNFNGRKVQKCMRDFIKPGDVIRSIKQYYKGGMLHYLPPKKTKLLENTKVDNK